MRKVLAGAAVLALLAGCERMTPPKPDEAGKPIFTRITAPCAKTPASLPVVRIVLTDVSPKKLVHDTALYESNQDGTGAGETRVKDIPEILLKSENPTRLDIDAHEFLKKAGDQLLVQVELADPNASFLPGKYALTAGNADGAAMFCVRDAVDAKSGDRTARFYVRYVESKTPLYGKYNLFLLIKDGPYTTPVVLDPKVHNAG